MLWRFWKNIIVVMPAAFCLMKQFWKVVCKMFTKRKLKSFIITTKVRHLLSRFPNVTGNYKIFEILLLELTFSFYFSRFQKLDNTFQLAVLICFPNMFIKLYIGCLLRHRSPRTLKIRNTVLARLFELQMITFCELRLYFWRHLQI